MKRAIILCGIAAFVLSSCVSLSEMEALQAKYDQTSKLFNQTQSELVEMRAENNDLRRQNQELTNDMSEVALTKAACQSKVDSLTRRIEQMHQHYDTTMENYVQEVAGKNRDLTRAQNLLTARTKELNDKERELQA